MQILFMYDHFSLYIYAFELKQKKVSFQRPFVGITNKVLPCFHFFCKTTPTHVPNITYEFLEAS